MKWILSMLLSLLLLLAAGSMWLVNEAVENHARVSVPPPYSREDLFRIQQLLAENDPRGLRPGTALRLRVTEDELNLMANYLLAQYDAGATRLALAGGRLNADMTLWLEDNPFGPFLNLTVVVRPDLPPRVLALNLGSVDLPTWLAGWLGDTLLAGLRRDEGLRILLDNLESIRADDKYLTVMYRWQSAMASELKRSLLGSDEIRRLRHYYRWLAGQTRKMSPRRSHSLTALLGPLLQQAGDRSVDGDSVAENRAALLVLAVYANAYQIESLIGEVYAGDRPRPLSLVLRGRKDLVQHFVGSSALAAAGGSALADAAGLYKEIRDSRGGSGFSFQDLAADRAGTRFGELATRSRASAHRLQERVAAGVSEHALLPATGGLPGTMNAEDLEHRVGGVGSPGFQHLQEEIERRIDALPLYVPVE